MSKLKEQLLLYKANIQKDPESFAGLYDLYVKQVYQFIFLKVRRREDAEDLTANTFLKAWQYISQGHKTVRNFRAFVYALARHLVVDFYRQKSRQESLFDEEKQMEKTAPSYDFLQRQEISEEIKEIVKALDKLPESYKEAIVLRHIEGLSIKEIAQVMKKTRLSARVLIHRAMKALKRLLS